jgi:hypothetical protein
MRFCPVLDIGRQTFGPEHIKEREKPGFPALFYKTTHAGEEGA